jgi:Mycothiol maleylpyruvate isomerase N-terminal domain
MHETRLTFLAAAAEARAVLVLADVEDRWNEASALAGMTIGALAAHLARAILTVQTYLASPVHGDIEPISAAAYFAGMDALSDLESEFNVGIRHRAEQGAAQGARALIESFDACHAHLRHALTAEPDDRLVEVYGKLVLPLDEYLLTRILELTVHADDLCVSIGRPTPALSGMPVAIALLVDVAELRHGEVAVLRALTRRERDTGDVLPVL